MVPDPSTSAIELEPTSGGTPLAMRFEGEPVTLAAKVMWRLTGWQDEGRRVGRARCRTTTARYNTLQVRRMLLMLHEPHVGDSGVNLRGICTIALGLSIISSTSACLQSEERVPYDPGGVIDVSDEGERDADGPDSAQAVDAETTDTRPADVRPDALDAAIDDVDVDEQPPCTPDQPNHYDCLGDWYVCVDGRVRFSWSTPVSCSDWTGECPWEEAFVCERGCVDDPMPTPEPGVALHCAGHPWSEPGDRCFSDAGCVPRPTEYVDGQVVVDYLRCSHEVCSVAEPPALRDDGAPCETTIESAPNGSVQLEESRACDSRICALQYDPDAECLRQGCTRLCEDDRSCPLGWRCEFDVDDRHDDVVPDSWHTTFGVCLPGVVGSVPATWACTAP